MCHQAVRPKMPDPSAATDEAPPAAMPQNLHEEDEQQDLTLPNEQNDNEQIPEDQEVEDENSNEQLDSKKMDLQGLRFSSSGDFVGFISPSNSSDHIGETALIQNNEGAGDAHSLQLPSEDVNGESGSSCNAELKNCNISCLTVPQNGDFGDNNECKSGSCE